MNKKCYIFNISPTVKNKKVASGNITVKGLFQRFMCRCENKIILIRDDWALERLKINCSFIFED